ncbi:hypothetical protein [Thalassospira marina]|uniref:hypothetical protein n=1 Tax=Thalassospira marina TaxID=2048283 RepID=UPI0010546BA1|nr:hypothetical protein [Thalassospira marina]
MPKNTVSQAAGPRRSSRLRNQGVVSRPPLLKQPTATKTIKKKLVQTRDGSTKTIVPRKVKNARVAGFGEEVASRLDPKSVLPKITMNKKIKKNFFPRIFEDGELREDKKIDYFYRKAWDAQDEFFSTATTRELIKGIESKKKYSEMTSQEKKHLSELLDIASAARMSTEGAGNVVDENKVMQHPANAEKALFADPLETRSEHAFYDNERKRYVEDAIERAIKADMNASEIVIEGVKASIEYSTNYIIAPIMAENVFKETKAAKEKVPKIRLQRQMLEREAAKDLYEELGGKIPAADPKETMEMSQKRKWIPKRDRNKNVLVAPPSPRRRIK